MITLAQQWQIIKDFHWCWVVGMVEQRSKFLIRHKIFGSNLLIIITQIRIFQ